MAKWLLIDGFNLAYRCFYAVPELTRADGFPTGALHGWVKSLWRLSDQEQPAATLVFFDLGGSDERLALHADYKAQRAEMPEALQKQIEPIKAFTRALGLVGVEQDGVESDDLLASQAVALARDGHDVGPGVVFVRGVAVQVFAARAKRRLGQRVAAAYRPDCG